MDDKIEEIRSTLEQIKAQLKAKPENKDKSDDEIDEIMLNGFLKAFDDGDFEKDDLLGIMDIMGYEPTEEFDKALKDYTPGAENLKGVSEEELKDARTIPEGSGEEGVEDFKEKISDIDEDADLGEDEDEEESDSEEDEEEDTDDDESSEVSDDDEDAQRKRASRLFGTDLTKK